jgi:hypothetical protein
MVNHSLKKGNEKLTLSINKEILKKYKELCEREGLVISKQVENFIKDQLKK